MNLGTACKLAAKSDMRSDEAAGIRVSCVCWIDVMAAWKLMSADACGDAGKATKYPDSANDEDDSMHVYMYI